MNKVIQALIDDIENAIRQKIHEADDASEVRPKKVLIKVLGQFALLTNPNIAEKLHIVATEDFDALFEGDWSLRQVFVRRLKEFGITYDELSSQIWIPPDSEFEIIYDSQYLQIKTLTPFYCLLSKAIKAPERNKFLIQSAIALYGEEFVQKIQDFGGNPEYFVK